MILFRNFFYPSPQFSFSFFFRLFQIDFDLMTDQLAFPDVIIIVFTLNVAMGTQLSTCLVNVLAETITFKVSKIKKF